MGWKNSNKRCSKGRGTVAGCVIIISIFYVLLFVSGCREKPGHVYLSKDAARPANPYQIPYDARSYSNSLEIFRGEKRICIIRSRGDLIERWGFIDDGDYVVIRSRGGDRQIVLQLFKTKTCKCVDEIELPVSGNKQLLPRWANSFIE